MQKRLSKWILVVAFAATPQFAGADPITILSERRVVFAGALVRDPLTADAVTTEEKRGENFLQATASGARGTNIASATATLISDLSDPHRLAGSGSASAVVSGGDLAAATGDIEYIVGFQLTAAHFYDFRGRFDGTAQSGGFPASASNLLGARLVDATGHRLFTFNGVGPHLLAASGMLEAGRYGLVVTGQSTAQGRPGAGAARASFEFTLDLSNELTPVPEPGSMLLLGSGLAALLRVARRRP